MVKGKEHGVVTVGLGLGRGRGLGRGLRRGLGLGLVVTVEEGVTAGLGAVVGGGAGAVVRMTRNKPGKPLARNKHSGGVLCYPLRPLCNSDVRGVVMA